MKIGSPRLHDRAAIVAYATAHPDLTQAQVGQHFGITQSLVSRFMRSEGVTVDRHLRRGRNCVRKPGQTDLEFHWETILHRAGLGMDRGLRVHAHRLVFGYDPQKANATDRSATLTAT